LEARLIEADALKWQSDDKFDGILLDVPCSATGTFRRHPEVLYRARPALIVEGAERQLALLSRAIDWLKPGGVIVYSVCSLEPAEGEQVIEHFLAANAGFRVQAPAAELPEFVPVSAQGWVRILPGLLEDQGGLDGFFMARLVRQG
jgi:16S rRNA (cytosine967-C5)-methyltransferase